MVTEFAFTISHLNWIPEKWVNAAGSRQNGDIGRALLYLLASLFPSRIRSTRSNLGLPPSSTWACRARSYGCGPFQQWRDIELELVLAQPWTIGASMIVSHSMSPHKLLIGRISCAFWTGESDELQLLLSLFASLFPFLVAGPALLAAHGYFVLGAYAGNGYCRNSKGLLGGESDLRFMVFHMGVSGDE
jgi:hypothetical protein